MKIVRMKREDLTEWRQNIHHLVDDGGHLVAQVDRALETAAATVMRSALSQRKTITQRVAIGKGPTAREHTIVVSVARTGINATDLNAVTTIDGHRVVTGREVVAARMLQAHGECQLRAPNGVIIKVVRDPNVHRPTAKESNQIAPRPEHCPCRNWGSPHPGRHYPTCEWNRLAPPDEKASSDEVSETEIRMLPTEAFESLKPRPVPAAATSVIAAKVDPRAVVAEAEPLDAPETCRNACLGWATPRGFPIPKGQHHPTCNFAKAWAIKTAREVPRWLIDLNTGAKVRYATNAEIGEADVQAQRTGSPIIHIEEVPYAVVLETELDAETPVEPVAVVTSSITAPPASTAIPAAPPVFPPLAPRPEATP